MLRKITLVLFLTGSYQGLAQQKPAIKFPPLSVVMIPPSQAPVMVPNPESYLQFLNKDMVDSILSPQEVWDVQKTRILETKKYQILTDFYRWYFTHLPVLVPVHKSSDKGDRGAISQSRLSQLSFLLQAEQPFTAQDIITLSERYNYTEPEKLNLFLTALYKNISDEELLKVLKAWKITGNKAIYIPDYNQYLNTFFHKYEPADEEMKQNTLSVLQKHKHPLTSLLHEAFNTNRKKLFKKILQKSNKKTVNTLNYFARNIGHLSSMAEWAKGEPYLSLLLQHPKLDWNKKDFKGWTPLFYAVLSSQDHFFPAVRLLLQQANIKRDIIDNNRKPLSLVASENGKPNIAKFLHQNGAPLSRYVSLQNSYIDTEYNLIKMEYKATINLDNLVKPLDWYPHRPSFFDFQMMNIDELGLPSHEIWNQFRYYFLLNTLLSMLQQEESARHKHIMWLLLNKSDKENKVDQWIRAIYRGDKDRLKQLLSEHGRSLLQKPLFHIHHDYTEPYNQQALLNFNLLERAKVHSYSQGLGNISFYMSVSSFLDEAIRANQSDSVHFFLSEGVDPTLHRHNILTRNNIITALLIGDLFLSDSASQKEHIRIIELLMSHPSVSKDFLKQEIIPGLTYPDLAGFKGHLPALQKIYEKGATISKENFLWDTDILLRNTAFNLGFFKTAEFIFKQQSQEAPKDPNLKEQLEICQRAFH